MGLFTSPQQYQQGLQTEALNQGVSLARLSPVERAAAMGYAGAAQVGRGLGGMLGAEDPQMKIAATRQQIMQQVDQTDPQSMAQAAQALNQAGDLQGARALAQAAQEAAFKQSQITKNLREGNAAMLTPEQRNFAQAQKDGYTGSFNQWLTEQKRAGATNVSLSSTADKSYGSELGGLVAKSDIALRDSANAAPEVLSGVQQTRSLLDSGKVFTGTGANAKLNVLALGQAFGVTGANDNDVIAKTQQLQQQRSKAVLSQIKASGLGTGQGFTDKDLNFLERASAGTITLSADTIREQLKIEEKLAKASVNKWNARVKTLPAQLTTSMGLSPVETPSTPYKPETAIPKTGNPLIDKYLVTPQQGQ